MLVPAHNTIRIDIDTASVPIENWCTAVDWVSLKVPAPDPVLLVHGILSGSGTWSPVWTSGLSDLGIPYEAIDMGALDSIQNNADKISARVHEMQTRWGVDKVNIVAHSKGGLDSREFAESSNAVDKLIQIGTPNAGSPLADAVQAGLFAAIPGGVVAGADLLLPAAYQLTTPYMGLYNDTHGFNPNTQYYSLAGNYKYGGLGIVDGFISLFYGDDSDLVVPVSSVHALSYSTPFDYASSGDNHQARHTGETSSTDIYNLLNGLLTGVVPHEQPSAAPAPPALAQATKTATVLDSVSQGGVSIHQLAIDNSSGLVGFTLTYATGDLDLSLVSPSGRIIDHDVNDPNIEFIADEGADGLKREYYAFRPGAEVGAWTVQVRGTSVTNPSGAEPYTVVGLMAQSNIQMTVAASPTTALVGQPLVIRATLTNGGAPLTGATVGARVLFPDRTTFTDLVLHDDGLNGDAVAGDGVYSGLFTGTTQAGAYQVLVEGQGVSPVAFVREAAAVAAFANTGAALPGPYSSTAVDTNGNSLYDQLQFRAGVTAPVAGKYRLVGTLVDSRGATIQAVSTYATLRAGSSTVELDFGGQTIFNHGVNGPYTLASVTLLQEVDGVLVPVASATPGARTVAYTVSQFEHSTFTLLGTGSERTTDPDHNGHFDTITVSLDAAVATAGFYQWSGSLMDDAGRVAAVTNSSGFLAAGTNSVPFTFDGVHVWSSRLNGPYHVGAISVVGPGSGVLTDSTFRTRAYSADDFQHGPNLTVTSYSLTGNAQPGQRVTFTYTVTNIGEQATQTTS